jgi:hypothetical protein
MPRLSVGGASTLHLAEVRSPYVSKFDNLALKLIALLFENADDSIVIGLPIDVD